MTQIQKAEINDNLKSGADNGSRKIKINLRVINKFLFISIIVFGVYYIVGVNDLSTKGFKLQELKKEVAEIQASNKDTEATITSLDSYNSLNKKINGLGMVPAGIISYVTPGEGAVARK